ncbi:MAG: hypothetical protein HQL01_01630 [Nitrospirae bacterium]|nr:hypothetical protein [Nitrospirota bacterium]
MDKCSVRGKADSDSLNMDNVSVRKITKPLMSRVYYRERLGDRLSEGLMRKVLWVSGPGGSGKTTLVASFIERMKIPCLWYRVDSYDDDIASFFYSMGFAAQMAAPGNNTRLPLLTPEYLGGLSRFTENYFEALHRLLPTPSAIVFDDYQSVPRDSKLHSVLYTGLSVLPEAAGVIIISREAPLPAYSPLRMRNELYAIGWEDIKFTYQESAELLQFIHGTVSRDEVDRLYDLSDGWVSALVVRHEKHKPGEHTSWLSSNRETLFNYFTSEIFDILEKDIQEFLIKTAFFKQMTVKMAKALTGCEEADKMLDYIVKKNYYTEKYDLKETAYGYNPLFRLFLQENAILFFSRAELAGVRNKAAEILLEHHLTEDAVELCIDSSNWETLSVIIMSNAEHLLKQGRTDTLLRWLNALPEKLIESSPWFLYFKGWATAFSNPAEGLALLEKAFNSFTAVGDMPASLLSWSGCVDVIIMLRGPFSRLDRLIDWINAAIGKDFREFPSLAIETSVVNSIVGILIFRRADMESAEDWLNRALELIDSDIDINSRLGLAAMLHIYFMYMGNFTACAGIIKNMAPLSKSQSAAPLALLAWSLQEAIHYHIIETNIEKCTATVKKGVSLSAESGIIVYEAVIPMIGAYGLLSDGRFDEADELIDFAASKIHHNAYFDLANLHNVMLYRDLLLENYASAVKYGEMTLYFTQSTEAQFLLMYAHLGLSQAYFEVKRYDDAFTHMELSRRCVKGIKRFEKEFDFLYPEAYYYLTLGERDRGLTLLKEALKQSARFNFTNIVFWRPKMMRKLFAEALKADMESEYVKSVIRARSMLPEGPFYELTGWPFQFRFHTLGRFQVVKNGEPVVFKGKAQKNAMALLKALIASGTSGVSESYISDILWPDADGDEAYISLKTTLHRLRQFLGSNEAIIFSGHKITLDFRLCYTDVFLLEEIHKKIDTMRDCLSDKSELNDDRAGLIRRLAHTAVDLYNGEFLPGDENYPWVAPAREALRNRFIDILSASVSCALRKEQWRDAERLCLRGIEVDALAENLYRSLIICYGKMDLPIEAHRTYNRFCDVLQSRLGIKPSFKIDAVK